jgi:hypothetical protein
VLSDIEIGSSFVGTDQPASPITSRPADRPRFEDPLFPPDALARQRMLSELLSRRERPDMDSNTAQPGRVA